MQQLNHHHPSPPPFFFLQDNKQLWILITEHNFYWNQFSTWEIYVSELQSCFWEKEKYLWIWILFHQIKSTFILLLVVFLIPSTTCLVILLFSDLPYCLFWGGWQDNFMSKCNNWFCPNCWSQLYTAIQLLTLFHFPKEKLIQLFKSSLLLKLTISNTFLFYFIFLWPYSSGNSWMIR